MKRSDIMLVWVGSGCYSEVVLSGKGLKEGTCWKKPATFKKFIIVIITQLPFWNFQFNNESKTIFH